MSNRRKFDLSIFINDASLTEINLVKKSVIEHLQIDTDVSFAVVETTDPLAAVVDSMTSTIPLSPAVGEEE